MVTGWLLGVASGLLLAMVALYVVAFAGRRRVLWCPERKMLAEVEVEGEAYATEPAGRRILFCSLWNPFRPSPCDGKCLTRFASSQPGGHPGGGHRAETIQTEGGAHVRL